MIRLQKEAGPDHIRWGLAAYTHSLGSLPKGDKKSLNDFKVLVSVAGMWG